MLQSPVRHVSYKIFDKRFTHTNGIYYVPDNDMMPASFEQVKANIDAVTKSLKAKSIVILRQVHGNDVYHARSISSTQYNSDSLPVADAVVTDIAGLALGIQTADCVPILLFNTADPVIGAVHCGWRGAKANIVKNTVALMRKISICNEIKAVIGPAIQQTSYEVGQEFYDAFVDENQGYKSFFIRSSIYNNVFLFDLVAFVKAKLLDENVEVTKIYDDDTFALPHLYYSYRYNNKIMKNPNLYGRMLSTIVINRSD